jgi:hypothetical protein
MERRPPTVVLGRLRVTYEVGLLSAGRMLLHKLPSTGEMHRFVKNRSSCFGFQSLDDLGAASLPTSELTPFSSVSTGAVGGVIAIGSIEMLLLTPIALIASTMNDRARNNEVEATRAVGLQRVGQLVACSV